MEILVQLKQCWILSLFKMLVAYILTTLQVSNHFVTYGVKYKSLKMLSAFNVLWSIQAISKKIFYVT